MTTNTTDKADQVEKDPKRFASSGTRRGNGAGHGGPAKGAGKPSARHAEFATGNKAAAKAKPAEG